MIRLGWRLAVTGLLAAALSPAPAGAHVGSPDTWFEGAAGPYPVRVVVRAPGVVPGLASVDVRVLDGAPSQVTAQPFAWDAGRAGAPPADIARPVPGASRLFNVDLWLMVPTSYGVHVTVRGDRGEGTAIVPVQAVATRRLPMERDIGLVLAALGVFLFVGLVTLVGAAVGESTVPPGERPGPARVARARRAMAVAAVVIALGLAGGRAWWNGVDRAHAAGLFRPLHATATLFDDAGSRAVRLSIDDSRWRGRTWTPLISDHGKLMHLFLVREPDLAAIAHLHPAARDSDHFESRLPPLPAGRYRVYADIVHESGFSQTLTASLELPAAPGTRPSPSAPTAASGARETEPYASSDPDDSWFDGPTVDATAAGDALTRWPDGVTFVFERGAEAIVEARDHPLRFRVMGADGAPATLERYLGMAAHAVVTREDGTVFAHLHPIGTVSMAAQMALTLRTPADSVAGSLGRRLARHEGHAMSAPNAMGAAMKDSNATGRADASSTEPAPGLSGAFSIPYGFPKSGRYRLWVQFKDAGGVRTAAFDVNVEPAGAAT